MPAGKLSVSPLTIHGLAQNGFPTSQTFVGCYVSPSEKQRTNSASGPEPHYQDTLTCQVNEHDQTLHLDVINEDPTRPGSIGSAQVLLYKVFESRKFEDWVPLTTSTGGPLGHIYMKLSFEPSSAQEQQSASPYGSPPPPPTSTNLPPSYNEDHGQAEERKIEVPHTPSHEQPVRQDSTSSLGPESPMPAQYGMGQAPYFPPQQPVRYNSQTSMPGGNAQLPPPVYTPPVYTPPVYTPPVAGVPPPVSTPEPVATPSPVVVDTPKPVTVDTPTPVMPPKKKGVPGWMKYGGAALAGAAAAGLGSWVKSSFDSDEEDEEEARKKAAFEQHQRAMEEEPYRSESFHDGPPPEQYHREYMPEQETFVDAEEHEEEEDAHEVEEEEEKCDEEEEEKVEEEAQEEESDKPYINDSKWR